MPVAAITFYSSFEATGGSVGIGNYVTSHHPPRKLVVRVLRDLAKDTDRKVRVTGEPGEDGLQVTVDVTRRSAGCLIQRTHDLQQLAPRAVTVRQRLTFAAQRPSSHLDDPSSVEEQAQTPRVACYSVESVAEKVGCASCPTRDLSIINGRSSALEIADKPTCVQEVSGGRAGDLQLGVSAVREPLIAQTIAHLHLPFEKLPSLRWR